LLFPGVKIAAPGIASAAACSSEDRPSFTLSPLLSKQPIIFPSRVIDG